jgi:hypothetical protein
LKSFSTFAFTASSIFRLRVSLRRDKWFYFHNLPPNRPSTFFRVASSILIKGGQPSAPNEETPPAPAGGVCREAATACRFWAGKPAAIGLTAGNNGQQRRAGAKSQKKP